MSIFKKQTEQYKTVSTVRLIEDKGSTFRAWTGRAYESDAVRAAIRPLALQASKFVVQHQRVTPQPDGTTKIVMSPEPYMRILLEEPSAILSMSKFLEKMATNLKLNNNAFALIVRDRNGLPTQIIPIDASEAKALYAPSGELHIRFSVGRDFYTFRYSDLIHLRRDICADAVFGSPNTTALAPLMNVVTHSDQGIIAAIKNSAVVKWLLKFNTIQRDDDIEEAVDRFVKAYMDVENGKGVAGTDARFDAIQVTPHEYVPNKGQTDAVQERIYSLFGVNRAIVQNSANEDELNSYYEGDVEPFLVDLQTELTRKLFTRRERAAGNKIVVDAGMLQAASLKTKLGMVSMVDRGAMLPNEWRRLMNLAPVDGGDVPIRRLDTAPTTTGGNNE